MNKSIVFLSFLFLMSCAKDSGSGSSGTSNPAQTPIIPKICQGQFQRSWLNQNRSIYNLYSNCTGTIPHCDAEFNYEIVGETNYGTIKVTLKKASPGVGCPVAPDYAECSYKVLTSGADRGNMELTCNGVKEIYTPRGTLE